MFFLLPLCYRIAAALRLTRLFGCRLQPAAGDVTAVRARAKIASRTIASGKRAKESAALSLCICRYGAR
jgi:hypothetical protein